MHVHLMMAPTDPGPPIDGHSATSAGIDDDFRMEDRAGIEAILGDIAWLRAALSVHTQSGNVVGTRAMHADIRRRRLVVDRGMQASDEDELVTSTINRFEGAIRGASVVFETGPLRKTRYKGKLAFEVPFPVLLYYVQGAHQRQPGVPVGI